MNTIRFDGRVAVITGAGAGLGRIYALEFAKRGAKVVVNDLGGHRDGSGEDFAAADTVVREIRDAGGEAVASYDSVASMEGGEKIIQTAVDAFGTVDVLINNAGILRDKSFLKLEETDWDSVINVHLKGAFAVSKAAFSVMKANGYGRILLTTSGAGLYGNFGQANYAAAKMGLVGLMNSISIEGQKYNILCNTIAPVAASRMTEDVMPPDIFDLLKPELIAPMVLYLASEKNNETKKIFNCAGGWFSRAEVICGPGVKLAPAAAPGGEISPEAIRENWRAICEIADGKPLNTLLDGLAYIL